jgi:DNA-binding MarR family transcriptional regulator
MTLAEIADAHGVDRPYATIIVDKLEALGFVDRSPHPTDRRSKVVSLTPAGREAAVTAERILQEPPAPLTALSEGQLTELVGLLTQLRAVLDRGGDPPEPPAALRARAVVLRRLTSHSPGLKARFAGPVTSASP